MKNADPFTGYMVGCGYCGKSKFIADGDEWPDCCPKATEWKARFARQFANDRPLVPDYDGVPLTLDQQHLEARWERVERRWRRKHVA